MTSAIHDSNALNKQTGRMISRSNEEEDLELLQTQMQNLENHIDKHIGTLALIKVQKNSSKKGRGISLIFSVT